MGSTTPARVNQERRSKTDRGRPTVGIRELKANASAIIEDVKGRRVSYAVTKRGVVEALIVPVDAGERLLGMSAADGTWDAWQALVVQLSEETRETKASAVAELARTRR